MYKVYQNSLNIHHEMFTVYLKLKSSVQHSDCRETKNSNTSLTSVNHNYFLDGIIWRMYQNSLDINYEMFTVHLNQKSSVQHSDCRETKNSNTSLTSVSHNYFLDGIIWRMDQNSLGINDEMFTVYLKLKSLVQHSGCHETKNSNTSLTSVNQKYFLDDIIYRMYQNTLDINHEMFTILLKQKNSVQHSDCRETKNSNTSLTSVNRKYFLDDIIYSVYQNSFDINHETFTVYLKLKSSLQHSDCRETKNSNTSLTSVSHKYFQ
ncbi:uncharacterized protein LOC112127606 [Cimex lectularius]|uniref:Uncharacterized protein n=1 Tax=Cimex lectularius TaxID=79782 RepID=A0A8I6SPH2_CIMLE|nr:uncharacterized protein LOC112127606 [Cimex lectularius]